MKTIATSDVFISYKAEDRARLKPLVSALESEGFSVWWDAHIGGGSNWREDIQSHLEGAKCVIVAWTKRSVGPEGNFVRDEATRAQRRGVYLPVRLDAVEPPLGFGEVQALSLQGWKGSPADERFRAVVGAVRSRLSGEPHARARTYMANSRISRRTAVAGGAGAVALAGAGGWFFLKPAPANAKRIAVLPFANLSGDDKQAYFSEGVAEELRAALSRIQFEVIGRASCEAVKDLDIEAAASKLRVANILTGSVRRSPETIRINAQLVSGSDGVERWAQSYDRAPGDAIKIQSDIAANVAEALSAALGQAARAAIALGGTSDSLAQDLILRAKELRRNADGPDGFRQFTALVDAAIARDSNYAEAHVEKANGLLFSGSNYSSSPADMATQFAMAAREVTRALNIAPKLGSAHATMANVEATRMVYHSALDHARRGVALSPNDPYVLSVALNSITALGDKHEGLRLVDRLIALDPLNGMSYGIKCDVLFTERRYLEAIEAGQRALHLAPDVGFPKVCIGYSLIQLNKLSAALAEFRAMGADSSSKLTGEAIVFARSNDLVAAQRDIARLRQLAGDASSYQQAQIHAQAGDGDAAIADLESALGVKDPGLIYAKRDPFLDPIRRDPRYAVLLRKLNFP